MKLNRILRSTLLAAIVSCSAQAAWESDLRNLAANEARTITTDWLIDPSPYEAKVYRQGENELVLSNGLLSRTFRLSPNAATVAIRNHVTDASLLRGVKPEAKITLDGHEFSIGGLAGQPNYAYLLPEWKESLTGDDSAFQFSGFDIQSPEPQMKWKQDRWAGEVQWPPKGVQLNLHFDAPKSGPKKVSVTVHYILFDGIPAFSKWLTIENKSRTPIQLNSFVNEILAVVEPSSHVELPSRWSLPNIHVESDMSFSGMDASGGDVTNHWVPDPEYMTQVNYARQTPLMLESRPPIGPEATLKKGELFHTFRTFELIYDSTDAERKGLSLRRFYRTVSPWASENPIMMHVRRSEPDAVKLAIDQCAEVGFEMVIMTFGSGFNMERTTPAYITQIKELVDYAHSKGVQLGGYSLLASRKISEKDDVVNPKTGKTGGAYFGNSPCLGSEWGQDYFKKLYSFIEQTGLDLLEHDGSYPGDVCASENHPGHAGLEDSQWTQWKTITDFYQWCRGRGVYLNVPDWYFLKGSNKTGMGYRETNWSLPRAQQIIHGRQNMYDGTWHKMSSMGWMFVPLVEYHGGGEAATLEPLKDHLDTYDAILAQNFGWGAQAAYRGPRLYDTDETKAVVKKWVDFYTAHRAILNSDVVHIRRADGQDYDAILHVNPQLKKKGLLFVWNPLETEIERTLKVPLYYTGLTDSALVSEQGENPTPYTLSRNYTVDVTIRVAPRSYTWLVIE
jgi:hypothetical protein